MSALRTGLLKGYYSVSGVIQDEDGNPISGSKLTITSYERRVEKQNKQVVKILPSGKFEFTLEEGPVFFTVYKDGHYQNRTRYSYIKSSNKERSELDTKTLKNDLAEYVIKRHDIRIVLDRIRKKAQLKDYVGRLPYRTDHSGTVMDFSKTESKPYKLLRDVKDVNAIKSLPKHCIIFTASSNKEGLFKSPSRLSKGIPESIRKEYGYPVIEYRLKINDPDPTAGFWLVDPKKEGKYHQDSRMREAPENGYVRELVFGSKQKYQIGSFYIKINGKYGKGKIDDNGYYHSSNEASCRVILKMQKDGSRNLEIRDWFAISPYLNYEPLAN